MCGAGDVRAPNSTAKVGRSPNLANIGVEAIDVKVIEHMHMLPEDVTGRVIVRRVWPDEGLWCYDELDEDG
ncbi:hypothetical protein [Actinoplanes solisilvae]|uniref:hypothetical protein n=1 Tax=Actinoplanes solisilvae TaxID=2486853 RepID=UPI000FDB09F3|nr:hypothetical protein [Actinoplanes solisilvae]